MRLLSVRLVISLILGVTLVSLLSSYYEVRAQKRGLRKELELRAEVLAESLAGNVEPYLDERSTQTTSADRRAIQQSRTPKHKAITVSSGTESREER